MTNGNTLDWVVENNDKPNKAGQPHESKNKLDDEEDFMDDSVLDDSMEM